MKIPILKIKNILLASIQVDLTDIDVIEFQNDVLNKINETEALGIVIDISALDTVDSFMARTVNDTVKMGKLLGAEVVITGIRPEVAITLVEIGGDLIKANTALNLEEGIKLIQKNIDNDIFKW